MSHALLCFASTFLAVFTLGLQSLNVNQGHYGAAALTSLGIGVGHIALYKYMPGADLVDVGAYLAGGVVGITASIWFHKKVRTWWKARKERKALARNGGRVPLQMSPPVRTAWIGTHHYMPHPTSGLCSVCGHPPFEHQYVPRSVGYPGDIR